MVEGPIQSGRSGCNLLVAAVCLPWESVVSPALAFPVAALPTLRNRRLCVCFLRGDFSLM